jgi:hypothetical protein
MMMVLAACTGSSADLDEAQAEIEQLQADLAAAQTQVAAGSLETQTVFVAGELAPAVEPQALGDGWANSESVRGGLHLVATFDSSGPDAWDIDAHPRVYFTSESYASNWFKDTDEGKTLAASDDFENFVGWHVVDAYSKEVIASALYSYEGNIVRGPHGVGVSPDGQWGYVGWTEETDTGRNNYVGVINVRTMKLDKLMKQESWREGAMSAQALHHIQAWTDVDGNEYVILQWASAPPAVLTTSSIPTTTTGCIGRSHVRTSPRSDIRSPLRHRTASGCTCRSARTRSGRTTPRRQASPR